MLSLALVLLTEGTLLTSLLPYKTTSSESTDGFDHESTCILEVSMLIYFFNGISLMTFIYDIQGRSKERKVQNKR